MTDIPISDDAAASNGLRPVNLRTDLGALADLLEIAFASSIDGGGRSAIREMRYLSRMSVGLNVLQNISELAQGMSLGYVWVQDSRIIGNVSVYPANAPGDLAKAWIIANVAVHPDYQRRGIALRLMQASQDMIRRQGGSKAILQVDADNHGAQALYRRLGFIEERAWITWRRSPGITRPPQMPAAPYITRRRGNEWQAEYRLAERVFPIERGGLGWLRPLHVGLFRHTLAQRLSDWLNLRSLERLIIRAENPAELLAALWIESGFLSGSSQLTLIVHPDYAGVYDEALLNTAVRRFGASLPLMLEHPADHTTTGAILRRYGFLPRREVLHMRWDAR
ncbi:MAG: GNAT family N-acetyltransferase [Chloroflexi bacterium]|nr:GNAT family N-acetyltransferase [Chloroflexota bacterium]